MPNVATDRNECHIGRASIFNEKIVASRCFRTSSTQPFDFETSEQRQNHQRDRSTRVNSPSTTNYYAVGRSIVAHYPHQPHTHPQHLSKGYPERHMINRRKHTFWTEGNCGVIALKLVVPPSIIDISQGEVQRKTKFFDLIDEFCTCKSCKAFGRWHRLSFPHILPVERYRTTITAVVRVRPNWYVTHTYALAAAAHIHTHLYCKLAESHTSQQLTLSHPSSWWLLYSIVLVYHSLL